MQKTNVTKVCQNYVKDLKIILQTGFPRNPVHGGPITVHYVIDTLMALDNPIEMFLFKVSRSMANKWINIAISFLSSDGTSIWLIAVFITYHKDIFSTDFFFLAVVGSCGSKEEKKMSLNNFFFFFFFPSHAVFYTPRFLYPHILIMGKFLQQ